MSLLDWTKSETISAPDEILIKWKTDQGSEREQLLFSTTKSTSQTVYKTLSYVDVDGNIKQEDVAAYKEDIKSATKASANQEFISMRLKYNLGLPVGSDEERSVTTYEYGTSTEGPILLKETTEVYISFLAFMGQLQAVEYAWVNVNTTTGGSETVYYSPPVKEVLSHRTIIEHEQVKTAEGRDLTRTKTSRWIALGATSEGKTSFAKWIKALKSIGWTQSNVTATVDAWTPLKFEGTEVQLNIGRAPVPAKPSDADLAGNEVTNGTDIPPGATPSDVFGNNKGWTKYLPPGADWQDYNKDSNGDGVPNWAPLVPDQWQDYNQTDGVVVSVPAVSVSLKAVAPTVDSPTPPEGVIISVPSVSVSLKAVAPTVNSAGAAGVPDWAQYLPSGKWQDYNQDSDTNGIPDWAEYLPSGETWQDYVTDPDNWENTWIDSNNDGVPNWVQYLPSGDWRDYVTDPNDWQNTAIDSNNDGTPDWAKYVPIGWEEFNSDSTYINREREVNNDKSITGQVIFDGQSYNDNIATVTATYDMPFAPDDFFYYKKGIRKLYRSKARAAARKFGQTEAALDIGHAFGQNIVTNFDLTPTLDLAPVYIRLAGIEGAFLLDAPSYAWGPEGMVVSSDLLLIGVSGYDGASAPASSWLRLPVATNSIGPASGTTVEASPVKANSIAIPNGFDVRNLSSVFAALPTNGTDVFREWKSNAALVPPSLVLERETIASGPTVLAVEFEYALSAGIDVQSLATGPFVDDIDPIPLASIIYSQSSVWEDNTAADATNMQDGSLSGTATGTNNEALAWVKMDLGAVYQVGKIVIGTATTVLPGGWSKSYTENNDIEYSTNGTTWTNGGTTGTFASEGIYEITVSFSARYVRITRADDYLALCELYALAPGQVA